MPAQTHQIGASFTSPSGAVQLKQPERSRSWMATHSFRFAAVFCFAAVLAVIEDGSFVSFRSGVRVLFRGRCFVSRAGFCFADVLFRGKILFRSRILFRGRISSSFRDGIRFATRMRFALLDSSFSSFLHLF